MLALLPGRGIHGAKTAPFSDLTLNPETPELPAQMTLKVLLRPMQVPSPCVLLKVDSATTVHTQGASVCDLWSELGHMGGCPDTCPQGSSVCGMDLEAGRDGVGLLV